MTLKEAHDYIEDMQRIMTQNRFIFSKEAIEANGKAIEALEKQIPMEPKIIRKPTKEMMGAGDCPRCGGLVIEWGEYCSHCGQHLDWGDGNDI